MKIFNNGFHFTCECGVEAEANVASDFHCVRCNGTDNYYVICPNCNKRHEVTEMNIPTHVKPYIKKHFTGLGYAD